MPTLADEGTTFRIQHSSSAMSTASLATADAESAGLSSLTIESEAPLSGVSGVTEQRAAEPAQDKLGAAAEQPQSSMPVLEASHRGSKILLAFIEPGTGRFRVRPSEEVLRFAEMDYTAVVRVVRPRITSAA